MLKVKITYPKKEEEREIIRRNLQPIENLEIKEPIIQPEAILKARRVVEKVYMDEKIEKYILEIVFATRDPEEYGLRDLRLLINYGGSPRASINLARAAKAPRLYQAPWLRNP
jgi:MoxR-like ATPase